MKKTFIFAIGLAAATLAQASVEVENISVTPSSAGLSGNITFNVPQFNAALGTLTGVQLILTPTFGDFGSEAVNLSSSAITAAFSVSNPNGSLKLGATTLATWSSLQTITSTYTANPLTSTIGPALPFIFSTTPSTVTVGTAGFIGSGNDNLVVTGSGTATSGGSGGSLFAGFYGNVGGNLEVDYTYSPVPETNTLVAGALLLLPIGASAFRVLRRNRAV